ncbi:Protein kinase domain-containing protein [Psidium guajava]|nr:Protein kinase domain-containing protein [Psidium guajava]
MAPPLATRLGKGFQALCNARIQREDAAFPFRPTRIRRYLMKKAQVSLNEAQHRMDTLLAELRQKPVLTLHTDLEAFAITDILWFEVGDRGKFRAVRIQPSIDVMELRSILVEAEFEEYYFLPDDAARRPPVSSPFMAPDLAGQLQRALHLGDAERECAKRQLPPAQAIMDRMIEELRTSECLDLYDLEQARAFLEIRKQLEIRKRLDDASAG